MLQAAYKIDTLFSISIIPSLPRELQTLHFMKFPGRNDLTKDLVTVTECRTPSMISMGKKVAGFLKPWEGYCSATFAPDPVMERCARIQLTGIGDIPTGLDDRVKDLLFHFLLDAQSKALGMVLIASGRVTYHAFDKDLSASGSQNQD